MYIQKIFLDNLIENKWNPNFMLDKEFAKLVSQIKRFGMRQPILVRPFIASKFEIIDGAHRARAAKEAGLKEIDCVVVDLNENEAKAGEAKSE